MSKVPGSFKDLIAALKRIVENARCQTALLEQSPRPDKTLIAEKRAAIARLEADLKLFASDI